MITLRMGSLDLTLTQLQDLIDFDRAERTLSQQVADAIEKLEDGEIDHIYIHITRGEL